MTAQEFIDALPLSTSPAGRLDLVQRGIKDGLISTAQARRLLEFEPQKPVFLKLVPPPEPHDTAD